MITTCPKCGNLYDAQSEEHANNPGRSCLACWIDNRPEMEKHLTPDGKAMLAAMRKARAEKTKAAE